MILFERKNKRYNFKNINKNKRIDYMSKVIDVAEIENLIRSGFEIELISFELDIPLDELKQIENNMNQTQDAQKKKSESKKSTSKLEKMRTKYAELCSQNNSPQAVPEKVLSSKQREIIVEAIGMMETITETVPVGDKLSKKKRANSILEQFNRIEQYPLSVEQAEKVYKLMQAKELDGVNVSIEDRTDMRIRRIRSASMQKLVSAIDEASLKTNDVEELRKLSRKITIEMVRKNQILAGSTRTRIETRISKMIQDNYRNKMRNEVSPNIRSIINDLAADSLDVAQAQAVIDEEAQARVANRAPNKPGLSLEQERKQLLVQIGTVLSEKYNEYEIINPKSAVTKIKELCGVDTDSALRIIVLNLIGHKAFKIANGLCDEFDTKGPKQRTDMVERLRKQIKYAEISDFVLRGLQTPGDVDDEERFFSTIERGIRRSNFKFKDISLGKTKDGTRTITLADIWPMEITKDRIR